MGGDPSATIHCDALGYDLAVAIRVGHRDGITLPQIIRIADLTARFDARAGIQGERPLPILLPRLGPTTTIPLSIVLLTVPVTLRVPTLDRSGSRAVSVEGLTSRC